MYNIFGRDPEIAQYLFRLAIWKSFFTKRAFKPEEVDESPSLVVFAYMGH